VGVRIQRLQKDKPWDYAFREWIAKAQAAGLDPNDVGDQEWSDDPLREALVLHYLPNLRPDSVVLELGPGTGRLTRHVISKCAEIVLVDYSKLACEWLAGYLEGRGKFRIIQIDKPALPEVAHRSIDAIFANGVFEHIDLDDLYCFLEEFHRVLKPGGVVAFNFDNIMTDEGLAHFRCFRRAPGERNLFRFYHPETVSWLCRSAGFKMLRMTTPRSRFSFIELQKPL
jgi:cyclopropane fatty-acyl-phospholipid synthase-like methyltransferase